MESSEPILGRNYSHEDNDRSIRRFRDVHIRYPDGVVQSLSPLTYIALLYLMIMILIYGDEL